MKMKTKLKLLFLALLGLILIPTTNAYELSEIRNWSESWAPPTTTRHRGMCLHYNRDWYMTFDGKGYSYADISRDNTSCSEWAVLGNFFAPRDYNSPWYEQIYNDYFSYVNSKQNGEWIDMIRTVYQNWEHKTFITTLPSRTAYKRTSNAGIDYMFTQIYFYHNQFILYDPVKEVGLSFLGKMNVVWGAVFANPGATEDNLRFIDYVRKKAYSATITNTAAWKWLLWTDVSMSRLQSMNWSKSYTMNKGGSSFLPPNFKIDKQGSEWFQYIEDIEFTAPDWNAGKPNNNWTWNQVAQNYRACVSRRSDIKILAQISKTCGDDPADEETLNWVKVDSWNWDGDVKTILDQLTGKNKTKCGRYANTKKKYHDKYSKEWESFSKDFNNYAFTPEALDVQAQCRWGELEQEHWSAGASPWEEWKHVFSWMINWNKSLAEVLTDERNKVLTGNDEISFTQWDYLEDTKYLRDLFNQCNWLTFGWLYQDKSSEDRLYYCSLYESFKQTLLVKYAGVDFKKAKLKSLDDLIKHLDNIKNKWVISTFTTELKERIKEPFSEVWTKLYSYVQDPYVSWYNHWLFVSCSGNVHIEWMDIFAYILFLMVVFTLLRYI